MNTSSFFYRFLQKGLPAGRIAGIRIHLHFTLFLLGLMWIWPAVKQGAFLVALFDLLTVALIFGSVLLHELGHCYGARLVGGDAREIILWPLGGLALIQGAEFSPKAEFIVTLLGPLVNVALAAVGWLVWWPLHVAGLESLILLEQMIWWFAFMNSWLALFNLVLPLFPMDSARLIRSAFSFHYHPALVTLYLCRVGVGLGIFLVVLGLFVPGLMMLGLIGMFGGFYSYQELMRVQVQPVYFDDNFFYQYDNPGFWGWVKQCVGGWLAAVSAKRKARIRKRRPRGPAVVVDVKPGGAKHANDPLGRLKGRMADAVAREDFREAARLRDEIDRMKN